MLPQTQAISLSARLAAVESRIAAAAQRAGRQPSDIALVAVSKGAPYSIIAEAYARGLRDFGENYVQESLVKLRLSDALLGARWHFIGHLQRNKVQAVCGRFALIQTVDSLTLGVKISDAACQAGHRQRVLVQLKLGDEESKGGVGVQEFPMLCDGLAALPGLELCGAMAIAPLVARDGSRIADPRPYFAMARNLTEGLGAEHRQILSMGMSADFEAAIEEGSTMVRIGSALLGPRSPYVGSPTGALL